MQSALREWLIRIKDKPIPVLARTADQLRKLNASDDAPVQQIVEVVEQDPGLTVQLLRFCNDKQGQRLQREVASVQQAIMLVGTRKLNEMAMKLPLLHKSLQEPARSQVLRTFCRAYHAGMQAVQWARQRRDMTPDEVFAASQLHFLGEFVLAMHAPDKLLETFRMRREKNIASEEAQYLILGFTLDELSLAIAEAWHLPGLVMEALRAENANHPRGFGIMLAVQLARHAAIDWYSSKTNTLLKQAAEWLNVPLDKLVTQTHQLAVDIAQHDHYQGVLQAAALLIQDRPALQTAVGEKPAAKTESHAAVCLMPQVNLLVDILNQLKQALVLKKDTDEIVRIVLQGMHDGVGLNRVVFAKLDADRRYLRASAIVGAENDPVFNRFSIKLNTPHLFVRLLDKSQAVCINDENRDQYWRMVPVEFQKLIGTNSFTAMSVFANGELFGMVYADRHTSDCQLDNVSYNYFKKFCNSLGQALHVLQRAS
jgi:HD-like signal output (HDOD) protein